MVKGLGIRHRLGLDEPCARQSADGISKVCCDLYKKSKLKAHEVGSLVKASTDSKNAPRQVSSDRIVRKAGNLKGVDAARCLRRALNRECDLHPIPIEMQSME